MLSGEDIEELVRAARKGEDVRKAKLSVQPCSFRPAGQPAGELLRAITTLHEGVARRLARSLGSYLRVNFEVAMSSVDQIPYGEFLESVGGPTYLATLRFAQLNEPAAMQIDHSAVFPMLDVLLGGNGSCEVFSREVTDIEEHIMEGVARIISHELDAAWAPLGLSTELQARLNTAKMTALLPLPEMVLRVSLDVALADASGKLNIILPPSVSNILLRRINPETSRTKLRIAPLQAERLKESMMDAKFPATLGMSGIKLPVQTILGLAPGTVCNLGIPVQASSRLMICGRDAFEAKPVRQARNRAAHVSAAISPDEFRRRS